MSGVVEPAASFDGEWCRKPKQRHHVYDHIFRLLVLGMRT